MNIITGINKSNFQVSSFKFRVSIANLIFRIFIFSAISMIVFACAPRQAGQEEEVSVKTDVKISSPRFGTTARFVSYQAVTRYMQSNDIRSQVTGIIKGVNCTIAGNIVTNQTLFIVQPQEAAALQKSKFSNQILTSYSDTVYSHISGQISKLNVQIGDFVQAGDILASCIRANSMRIIAYIPVEQVVNLEKAKNCTIILPDGKTIPGKVSGKLTSSETQDQTQAYIIEPQKTISLAENINLTVQFTAEQLQDALFVPESAVLGNEEQTSFWVMKLLDDSTCIKVLVEKGIKQDSLIQVIGSDLDSSDFLISEGGYGLPDSASVQIINKK